MVISPIINDGRINRSKTTLNKIVAATISLLRKNNNGQIPTAQEIAVKSGVGIRTVFRHIDDMEGLIEEVNRHYLKDLESSQDLLDNDDLLPQLILPYRQCA